MKMEYVNVAPWNPEAIDARLTPTKRFDQRDDCWASWSFSFVPEHA